MSDIRFYEDELSIRRQLGIDEVMAIPDIIAPEYEHRITMLHRDGRTGPMGTSEVMNMLRYLGIEPIRRAEKRNGPVDWQKTPIGTRVLVKRDVGGRPMRGILRRYHSSGMLSIESPEQDPRIQQYRIVDVMLDEGQLEKLAEAAKMTDDQWSKIEMGAPVISVDDKGKEVEGILGELGPGPTKLTLLVDGYPDGMLIVDRSKSKLRETAEVAL